MALVKPGRRLRREALAPTEPARRRMRRVRIWSANGRGIRPAHPAAPVRARRRGAAPTEQESGQLRSLCAARYRRAGRSLVSGPRAAAFRARRCETPFGVAKAGPGGPGPPCRASGVGGRYSGRAVTSDKTYYVTLASPGRLLSYPSHCRLRQSAPLGLPAQVNQRRDVFPPARAATAGTPGRLGTDTHTRTMPRSRARRQWL
jgi:hypothetical protein